MEKSNGNTVRVPIATQGNTVKSTWMTWESNALKSVIGYNSYGIFLFQRRL